MNTKTVLITALVAIVLVIAYMIWFMPAENGPVNGNNEVETQNVLLFYYDPDLDLDDDGNVMCSREGLVSVEREVAATDTLIEDTVRLLMAGDLTEEERERGITTEFPLEGVELEQALLENNSLTLFLSDPQNRTTGGACRTGILWAQIAATGEQFAHVSDVHFEPEDLFQP
jgi:hypothetical protein